MLGHRRGDSDWDRGASVVEAAILLPALMLMSMMIVQATLWFHTEAVATTAASKGVDAARIDGGTEQAGYDATEQFLEHAPALQAADVSVQRGTDAATVTITGNVTSVLFGLPVPGLTVTAEAPLEQRLP